MKTVKILGFMGSDQCFKKYLKEKYKIGIINYYDEILFIKNLQFHHKKHASHIFKDGEKSWYYNGERHNISGPAIEYSDPYKEWHYKNCYYGNGTTFTNKSWKKFVKQLKREEELKIFI